MDGTEHFSSEEIIKKSRFVSFAKHVENFDDAMIFLKKIKDPKASHNPWAYRSKAYERYNDDGEPVGTAGKPILTSLEAENVYDIVLVVTRYFGGIKLGSSGLVRAYTSSAASCIRQAPKRRIYPTNMIKCVLPFSSMSLFVRAMNAINSNHRLSSVPSSLAMDKISEEYDEFGNVSLKIYIYSHLLTNFLSQFKEFTRGEGSIEVLS
jgi:uncharacterized YigZ family protein